MIDFHCHLDLFPDPISIFSEVKKRVDEVLVVTTSPKAYVITSKHLSGAPNVRIALGFHPELVKQRSAEIGMFFEQMRTARYIGEIGIDGSQSAIDSISEQRFFFEKVVMTAARSGGKLLSIHSRGATKEVLQILEHYKGGYVPILHWFTGTPREVERALKLGCWFSINPNMCYTNTGRRIISCIPLDRMLPETDSPFARRGGKAYMPWDTTVTSYVANENGIKFEEMNQMFHNSLEAILYQSDRSIMTCE